MIAPVPAAYAASIPLLDKIKTQIVNPLILLFLALAVVFFLYGVYEAVSASDNEEKRREGRQHMLWGIIGIFVMVSVFGILQVICRTLNVTC